ncbi:hypothetical protein GEV33_012278 [Tenebrio molitor]|uniref:Uncharacterized protein n=1 Tax=Tenebrio molitor TaxID=7067 RepID=A0A8J6HB43_TENMO|nr:hypothetical protein GEV33_012278 [Tenebrio molitor]
MENVVSEDGTIYIKMAFKNLCRLCLTEADLEPLNEPRFCENFNISLFFERELGRQLPESVCGECLMQMNQIDSFIKKWKEAQEVISQIEAQCEKMRAIYNVQIVDAKCDDTTDCSKEEVFEFSVEDAVTDTEGSGISALCEPTLNEEIIIQEDSDEIIMSECNCTSDTLCENCIPYTPMLEEEIIIEEQLENNMLTSCESVLEEDRVEDDQLLQEHLDETTAPELNCTDVKICEKCGEFVTKMKIHYQTSKDCRPKNFKCVECNTAFRSSRKLKDHEVAYHWKEGSVKLFLCDKCSQTFKYQVNLNRHLHTHEEGKRFVCEKCGKVYTDLSKAFDRIDHGLLLIKLESFGFSDNLVELIRSYLSDRFMYVGVNGYASKPFKQESGVPQGSVLGPLFFNIFINDLVDDLDVPHLLFADDMKIYLTIDSIDDALRLQGCIEEISRRCKLNNLVLNHLKCSIVSFTRKTKPLLFDYKINGSILTRRESIRDLGVIFDSKLSFGEHIRTIAGTAFRALGFVLRAGREFSDVATLKLLYITYVRSRLEYASLVWSPIYDVHSSLLERVQRRFLKNVVFMLNGAYPPRGCPQGLLLGEVGLQSLLDRRMEHSVIFLFKLFRGLQECPHVLERISLRVSRSGSRVRSVFYIGQRHTDIGLKSPVTRMLRNYQSVEAHIDIFCCSISQIKKFFSISS